MSDGESDLVRAVSDKHWLLGEPQRPEAIPAIQQLEMPRQTGPGEAPEPDYQGPVFISHLNNVECDENDKAHFECTVEPAKDPHMKIGESV